MNATELLKNKLHAIDNPEPTIQQQLRATGSTDSSTALGKSLWTWSLAAELWAMAAAGVSWADANLHKYTGRAAPPKTQKVAAIPKTPTPVDHVATARAWSAVERTTWTLQRLLTKLKANNVSSEAKAQA